MSVELTVFLNGERLPTRDQWQAALIDRKCELHLDEFSTRTHAGFLPAHLHGLECGFEYYYDSVKGNVSDQVNDMIGNRDQYVTARFFGNENDLRAAMLALAALAELADGLFFDPQSGEMVAGSMVFQWIKQTELAERERRMAQAEQKWAHVTERRCPECGAPCPEYRKSCAVCGFEIGRA